MILPFYDKIPRISPDAFVAPNATLIGGVTLGAGASVWYGAVLRADTNTITIGSNSNVQDNAVLHTEPEHPVSVGDGVTIGHSAIVHGCTVGDGCLIGMHATLMNGCVLGRGCIVAAGALVPQNMAVPDNSLVMGVPAKIRGPVTPEQAADAADNLTRYAALTAAHRALCEKPAPGLHAKPL
jgi:carbonic anhydrase/acetyltransferase-like protein (isoleucine patch superfamily)